MARLKSKYRIVPTTHEKFGSCWALKEGESVLGTFISKEKANTAKLKLEKVDRDNFILVKTVNQELKIEE